MLIRPQSAMRHVGNAMKKILLISLLIPLLFLAGCNLWDDPWNDYDDVRFTNIPPLGLTSVEEVMKWTSSNIRYQRDEVSQDIRHYFQSPGETYAYGTGDCEDFSALSMYLMKVELGVVSKMTTGISDTGAHAWVSVDNVWWEPQSGNTCYQYIEVYSALMYWDYSMTMWRSVELKRSVM